MKYKNYFVLGDRLKIETLDYKIDENKELISQIIEINSDDEFTIAIPIHNGSIVAISVGSEITVEYIVDGKGVYYFKAIIIERQMGAVPFFKIKQISNTKSKQRREHYRIETKIPIKIFDEQNNLIGTMYTKDLSGGGMKFIYDKNLEKDKIVFCTFKGNNNEYNLKSKILRCDRSQMNSSMFNISIEFLDIAESVRNDIIKYVFEKQRIDLKRGLS